MKKNFFKNDNYFKDFFLKLSIKNKKAFRMFFSHKP